MSDVSFRPAGGTPDADYGSLMRLDIQYEFYPKRFFCPKWDYIACNRAPDDPRRHELDPNDQEAKAKERFIAMLADDRYREAFAALVQTTLDNYLIGVEHELEFWHRNGQDLSARIKSDENVIFDLLEEFGPEVLRYPSVQDKVQEWCGENCLDKFRSVKKALDIYKNEVMHARGFLWLNVKKRVVTIYPVLKDDIKNLKREIREHNRRAPWSQPAARQIIGRWRKKGSVRFLGEDYRWFNELVEKAQSRGAHSARDVLNDIFNGEQFPRKITLIVLGHMIYKGPAIVDRIIRDARRIRKSMYDTTTRIGHRV